MGETQVEVAGAPGSALERCADGPLVVLTGAGVSTDSGIPDYRGPGSVPRTPMTYGEFVSGPAARQRYWARSHLGFTRMKRAEPNPGHTAVAALGADLVITQNVDGLHERVGTPRLVALHGRIADVVCLGCGATSSRLALQELFEELNPGWAERHRDVEVRPDGDVDLEETADFVVPACSVCDGVLKPDVVFFGENVPKARVERCFAAVEALGESGGTLLVAGSSLTVMSGLRFVRRAAQRGVPVVIVNRGDTRGDDLASHRVHAGTSCWLVQLATLRRATSGGPGRGRAPYEPVRA
ncbi:MAG: Sir2 family NAD-dependent protein deacetylase [Nocardioides sp.]|uniref:Sir2 family NAD-dependent protein deacetylase n=1 Tax=Nocardioides sp. TaxID=35761 RepID=UPI003F107497